LDVRVIECKHQRYDLAPWAPAVYEKIAAG